MAWLIHKSTQNATPQLSDKATHRTRYQLPTHLACSLPGHPCRDRASARGRHALPDCSIARFSDVTPLTIDQTLLRLKSSLVIQVSVLSHIHTEVEILPPSFDGVLDLP
jgi:hypothetical protein